MATKLARFLSDEWIGSLSVDGAGLARCSVEFTVTGGPDGDVKWHLSTGDGALTAAPGPRKDADVMLTLSYEDAVAVTRGELEPSVAFMQGRMKTAGDPGMLLDLVEATARPAYREERARLAAATEF